MTNSSALPACLQALTVSLLIYGCPPLGSDVGKVWSGSIDTLSSGQIEIYNKSDPLWLPAEEWQVIEELRIGSDSINEPALFGSVVSFDVDARGHVYILDGQAQEIRIFDPKGAFVRKVGTKGSGPGELSRADAVDLSQNGEIWVMEMAEGQVSIFDSTGSYVRGQRLGSAGWMIRPYPGGFDPLGRYNVAIPLRDEEGWTVTMARFDQSLTPIDTIAIPDDPYEREVFEIVNEQGSSVMRAGVPFQGSLVWRFSPTGNLWTLLTDKYELTEITTSGKTLRRITKGQESLPVTATDRNEVRESLEWFTSQGGKIDWSKIPAAKPATVSFFSDDENHLWVALETAASEDEGYLFDIFDPQGRFLGTVRLPFSLRLSPEPIVRDGILYGITADELGALYVVRAKIVKS